MGNIICGQCGEPWEYYYVMKQLSPQERDFLLRGVGCPVCEWGDADIATGDYQNQRRFSLERAPELDPQKYI